MLFIGVAVLLTTVFIVLLVGHYVLKIPYDDLVGVASGATGNPAILVYSTKMAPTERPDIGYAMIFPSMTLVKVIAAQIVGLLGGGRRGRDEGRGLFEGCEAREITGCLIERPRRNRLSSICRPTALPRSRRPSKRSGSRRPTLPLSGLLHAGDGRGGGIGFGALYYTIVASDPELSFATVARGRRTGVFARAGARPGGRRRTVYGQQPDRDGLGKRKGLDGRCCATGPSSISAT